MKSKFMKKTLAAALTLTIVGGGLPAITGGADIFKSAIVANAIDGLAPEVGKVYNWGECIQLGELYLKDDYFCVNYNELIYNYITIEEPKYIDDKDMWSIGYAEGAALCALKSATDRHYEIPIGVKIVSGTGAYNDPFTMELVYSGDAVTPEEVTVGKKWYVGDTINTDAYFIGGRGQVVGESDAPTRISFDSNFCKFHLINKKLTSAYKLHDIISEEDFLVFPDTVSTTYTSFGVEGDGYPTGLAFEITSEDIIGIEVTGGSGTKDDPFTLAPITANQPKLVSNSMTLGGAISLNFYIDLSGVPEEWRSLNYVDFEVNGQKQTAKFDANKMNSSKTAYGFTCMLNSISMADDVKATLYYYDLDGIKQSVSTTSTAETYLKKFNSNDTEKLWNLIKGINDYGYYMQKYLSKAAASPWTLGVDHKAMSTAYTKAPTYQLNRDTYLSEMANLKKEATPSSDIERFNYALSLDSDTSLIVKIKPKSTYKGSISVKVTDASGKTTTVTPTKLSDGRYQITINNISAHKLADMYTVTVKTTNGTSTFKASALTYAYEGIQLLSEGDEYNAMCALYEYYKTSKAYKG